MSPRGSCLAICLGMFLLAARLDARAASGTAPAPAPAPTSEPGVAPQRIVSLAPTLTEIVAELGRLDRLVGVTRFDDFPAAVKTLPHVGGLTDLSIEGVVALRPDLVLALDGPTLAAPLERLRGLGIRVVTVPSNDLAQLWSAILQVGAALGAEREAGELRRRVEGELAELKAQAAGKPRRRALMLVGVAPWIAAGRGSYLDELLPYAGLDNVVAQGGPFPQMSSEGMMSLRPEVLVLLDIDCKATTQALGLLGPVRAGRVVCLEESALVRRGPRLAQAVTELARAVTKVAP